MTVLDNRSLSGSHDDGSIGSRSRRSSNASAQGSVVGRGGEEELMLSDDDDDDQLDSLEKMYTNKKDGDEDVALVGSISHILRTLFRDLYVNPAVPPGTKVTPPPPPIVEEDMESGRDEDDENEELRPSSANPAVDVNSDDKNDPSSSNVMDSENLDQEENNEASDGNNTGIDRRKSSKEMEAPRPMSPGSDDGESPPPNNTTGSTESPLIQGSGDANDVVGMANNGDETNENVNIEIIDNNDVNGINFDNTQFTGTMVGGKLGSNTEDKEEDEESVSTIDGDEPKLNANQKAAVEAMRKIDKKLVAQLAECSKTIQMLKEARMNAEISDKIEENELKSRGILVSAHIPIGPSHLSRTLKEAKERLDMQEREEAAARKKRGEKEEEKYPSLVSELISARSLMLASLNKHLYKSGNLKRNPDGDKKSAATTHEDHTGFLKMTRSLQVRKNMVLSISHGPNGLKRDDSDGILGNEEEMDHMLRSAIDDDGDEKMYGKSNRSHKSSDGQMKKKQEKRNVNEEQHDLDLKVLQRMEQKLKFTRNPRHDPSNKNNHRLLTLPPAAPLIPSSTAVNASSSSIGDLGGGVGGNLDSMMSKSMTGLMGPVSNPDTDQVMQQWENRKIPPPPGDHGFFVASPPIIEFTEYDVNGRYEAVVHVRNVTSVARSLTILPLTTHFFAVAKVQFPSATQGSLAPGMAVAITVRFEPDSLADYEDHLTVKNEGYDFPIHVWAHRPPPILSIPNELDIGACLVGDAKCITFKCKNTGGRGKFRLLCPADFPEPRTAQRNLVSLRMDPFNVTPTEFSLANGEEVSIIVEYIPLELGFHEASFVLVCDNCQISTYSIRGQSEEVAIDVCEVNGGVMTGQAELRQLHFDPLPISAKSEQTFSLQNTTCLDLNFRWEFRPEDVDVVIGTAKKTDNSENSSDSKSLLAPFNGFNIRPRRGTITAKQDQLFVAEYSPLTNSVNGCRAVLVVEDIPPPSVPSMQQADLLEALHMQGHGELLRLEAWFKSLSDDKVGGNGGEDDHRTCKVDYEVLHQSLALLKLDAHQRALREISELWSGRGMLTFEQFLKNCPIAVAKTIEAKQPRVPVLDIQKKTRRNVETIALTLKGAGEDVVVSLSPPSIQIPGQLLVSQSYVKKILVSNFSNCSTTFSFGSPLLDEQDDPGAHFDFPHEFLDSSKQMLITVDPAHGTLEARGEPGDQLEVLVCLTPLMSGRIDATIPCVTGGHVARRHSSINTDNISQDIVKYRSDPFSMTSGNNCVKLRIGVDAIGPRIAFNQPEVDLGLMAVLGKMSVPITFTNVGAVPCAWHMKQAADNASFSPQTSPSKKHSKYRNSRLEINKAFSSLECSPAKGLLGPNETATTYVICECGHQPERLRSTLTCEVKGVEATSHSSFEPQYISVRGEVQAPKVFLDISELNLGTCFIGVPVTRTVTLRNLSNLSTQFNWQRCLGPDPAGFSFKFSPEKGTIGEKQTLQVKFTMTAKTTGMLSELFACECYGMHRPIGFELKSSVRGVVVAYESIEEGAEVPKPLGSPTDVQYMGSTPIPVAGIAPKFNFGDSVPLFERRTIRFAIRNLSAIACPFTIQPTRYKVSNDIDKALNREDNDINREGGGGNQTTMKSLGGDDSGSTQLLKSKKIKGLYTTVGDRGGNNSAVGLGSSNMAGTAMLTRKDSSGGNRKTSTMGGTSGGHRPSSANIKKQTGSTSVARLLDNTHEPQAVYQSSAGKAHIAHRLEKMEDRAVLSRRNGAAFAVTPSRGMLEPWGCVVVTVTAFNEMPGTYDDDLECHLEGALLTRLNLHMSVTGCPLKLSADCVGLDSRTDPSKPKLQFGDIINGSQDTTKLVRIRNEGPIGARVSWDVRSPDDDGDEAKDNRFVDVSLVALSNKGVKNRLNTRVNSGQSANTTGTQEKKDLISVKINWHTRKEYTPPYSISPSSALIQPHSSANFKVTLHSDAVAYKTPAQAFQELLGGGNGLLQESHAGDGESSRVGDIDADNVTIQSEDGMGEGFGGNSVASSVGGGNASKKRSAQSASQLNIDVGPMASYDGSVQVPSMVFMNEQANSDKSKFDLVQAVMVMNAEWIHGDEIANTTTGGGQGSSGGGPNNFSGDSLFESSQTSGSRTPARTPKSPARTPMGSGSGKTPSKKSSQQQQQVPSRLKTRTNSGLTRETKGAIKVYLSATPTAPRLQLDKQVHADKNGDQFLRFSALSTQTHSMEVIARAVNNILPKVMANSGKSASFTGASGAAVAGIKRLHSANNSKMISGNDSGGEEGGNNSHGSVSVQDLTNYQLRSVVFTNPLGMPLTFSVSTTEPFRVLGSKCLAPPHPLNKGMMASALSTNSSVASNTHPGGIFTLPPQEAVTLYVAYLPQPTPSPSSASQSVVMGGGGGGSVVSGSSVGSLRKQSSSSAITMPVNQNENSGVQTMAVVPSAVSGGVSKKVGELRLKSEHEGTLAISFSTGQIQRVKLVGVVSRPMVVCAPAEYGFGLVHTESYSEFLLFLSNPTEVDAKWKVVHLPVSTPKYSATYDSDNIKTTVDDPNVFSFGQLSGVQQGPCYPLVAAGASLPLDFNQRTRPSFQKSSLNSTYVSWNEHPSLVERLQYRNEKNYQEPLPIKIVFRPNGNHAYQSRFRFIVENGEGFDVVFSGKGTYEENTLPNRPPKVGPRMYDGF